MPVRKHDIEKISRFIATNQREQLVDREIDGVKHVARNRMRKRWQEAPSCIVSPVDLCGFGAFLDDGANDTGLLQTDLEREPRALEQRAICCEGSRNPLDRVVKVVEVVAEALGARRNVHGRAAHTAKPIAGV